jgi:D-3-phosphoglycerate dehydrogenase
VRLEFEGAVAEMNVRALTAAALAGFLQPVLQTVNMVSAFAFATERGIQVEETRRQQRGAYESYIRLSVFTESQERSVAGTVFSNGKPRIIQIKGIDMEAELGPHMLYVTNRDRPGFIGRLGTLLGERGHNIATFHLGRQAAGGDAIALVEIDGDIPDALLASVQGLEGVVQARHLTF